MVTDACLFVNVPADVDIIERLSPAWQGYLGAGWSSHRMPIRLFGSASARNPEGEHLAESYPSRGGLPGSDLASTSALHLDACGISRAVVSHDVCRSLAALPDHRLCRDTVRAANDWMREVVLAADSRLSGVLLLPMYSADAAAEELSRLAGDNRWAAVALAANGLGQPFGSPAYRRIHEVAAEAGLPLVVDTAADSWMDVRTDSTGTRAATFTDLYVLRYQALSTHFVSMVGQGVFERLPELKVFFVGAGIAWVIPLLWRYDSDFKAFHRDAPGLSLLPSEYFARNARVGTYAVDRFSDPAVLRRYLAAGPMLADTLCYASGYPSWDRDTPDDLARVLPPDWAPGVFGRNAESAFRLPAAVAGSVVPTS